MGTRVFFSLHPPSYAEACAAQPTSTIRITESEEEVQRRIHTRQQQQQQQELSDMEEKKRVRDREKIELLCLICWSIVFIICAAGSLYCGIVLYNPIIL